jgi:hypothetical protein
MLRLAIILAAAAFVVWQAPGPDSRWLAAALTDPAGSTSPSAPDDYICPMDRDVHSRVAGKCPRCGMALVSGYHEPLEYQLDMRLEPRRVEPGQDALVTFHLVDPRTLKPARDLEIVHEKRYHLFVVSQDLQFFLHTHPEENPDGDYQVKLRLPKPGMYRLLSDLYPKGGTPQLIAKTVMAGSFTPQRAQLGADLGDQRSENSTVNVVLGPSITRAGERTHLNFRVSPNDGIEPYLGTMAHLFSASADLIDMTHSHPTQSTDRGAHKELQFDMIFPRPGMYRVWVQFQRKGVVNTAAFNVPVV